MSHLIVHVLSESKAERIYADLQAERINPLHEVTECLIIDDTLNRIQQFIRRNVAMMIIIISTIAL